MNANWPREMTRKINLTREKTRVSRPVHFIVTFAFCYTEPQVIFSSEIHGAINFYSLFFTIYRSKYRKERLERGRGKRNWEVKILPKPPDRRAQRRGRENVWIEVGGCHGDIFTWGEVQKHFYHYPQRKQHFSHVHSSVFSAIKIFARK